MEFDELFRCVIGCAIEVVCLATIENLPGHGTIARRMPANDLSSVPLRALRVLRGVPLTRKIRMGRTGCRSQCGFLALVPKLELRH